MAYETEMLEVSEGSANRISFSENAKTGVVQLTRGWRKVTDTRKQSVLDYLKTVVAVQNPKYDNGKATAEGLFRVAESGWSDQSEMYFQVLRLGWSSTVLNATGDAPNTLPDDEWQIQTGSDSRSDARSFTFLRRNVASTSVNAAVTALRTLGAWTNPTVQGEAKTGVYAFANIVPMQQEDGSYWITIEAIKTATITAIENLSALSPVRLDTRDIENPFGLEGGYSAHVGRKPKDGIVLTFRALSIGSRAVLMAMTDAQLQGILSAEEQLKYEFIKRELAEDSGNTLKLVLSYQYIPLATSAPESAARLNKFELHAQSGKVHLWRSWPRLTGTAAHNELQGGAGSNAKIKAATVTDPVAVGSDGVSRTYTGEWLALDIPGMETDNDGMRIVQHLVKAGDQAVDVVLGPDPLHKSYEFYRWDASKTLIDAFLASADPFGDSSLDPKWSTSEVGITKIVKVDANSDRSLNLYAAYLTTAGLDKVELFTGSAPGKLTVRDSYYSTMEYGFGWNVPVASLKTYSDYYKPVSAVVNTKNEFKITRRDEHTFDFEGVLQTFVPIDSGDVIVEDTKEKTVIVRTGSYLTGGTYFTPDAGEYVRPTASTPNVKVEIEVKDNAYGSKDAVKKTTTFKEIDDGGIVIEDTAEKTVTRRIGSHILAAKIAAGGVFGPLSAQVEGTEVVVDAKLNDVQTYEVVRIATVYHEQTGSSSSTKGTIETIEEDTAKATATDPTLTDDAVNKISAIEISPRKDGLKDTVKKDTTLFSKTLANAVVTEKDAFHTKTLTKIINGTSVTGPATYGKASVDHNGAGGVHTDLEEVDEINVASQDKISTPLETITIDKNTASTAATLGTVSQNNGSTIKNKPTPGGNFESEKVGTVKTPWDSGDLVLVKNFGGVFTESMKRFRNSTTIPAATPGQLVKAIENELASFDGEVIERNIVAGAATGFLTVGSSIYEWKERNGEMRFPVWTTSTDSSVPQRITGYNIYYFQLYSWRTVTVTVTRAYSATHPAAAAQTASGRGNAGGGTSVIQQVIELAEGLFALETKTIVVSDWTNIAPIWQPIASI